MFSEKFKDKVDRFVGGVKDNIFIAYWTHEQNKRAQAKERAQSSATPELPKPEPARYVPVEPKHPLEKAVVWIGNAHVNYCSAGHKAGISDYTAASAEIQVAVGDGSAGEFSTSLVATEKSLLNARTYGSRLQDLASRIESDLETIRGAPDDRNALANDEFVVLEYMKNFVNQVDNAVATLRDVASVNPESIKSTFYGKATDQIVGRSTYELMSKVDAKLRTLESNTKALLNLEKQVDKLSVDYMWLTKTD